MSRWLVKAGETVRPGQGLLEVLTDKATMEVPAPFFGVVESLTVKEGAKIKIGDVVMTYQVKEGKPVTVPAGSGDAKEKPVPQRAAVTNGPAAGSVKAAPSVRVMAHKLGIDLSQVRGSGPGGRILIEDLAGLAAAPGLAKPQAADYGRPGTRQKFQGLRRKIAEHMVHAKHTIPHYTYVDECDVTDLVKTRDGLREPLESQGVKITYLPFFVKAVARALKEVPIVNASLDDAAGEIVLHDKYHVGIAVATPGGLVVPVIRDADRRTVVDIAREMERLSSEARAGKSKLEDLRGGTFTLTSVGNIGGLFATPIIHHPQVGILGIGKIVKRPVFDAHGQVRAADMVYLSFSFDHRVLDGAVGAAFANAVLLKLKNPVALLVE